MTLCNFLVVLLKMHTSVKILNGGFSAVAFHSWTVVNPVVGGRGLEGALGVHQTSNDIKMQCQTECELMLPLI